MVSNIQILNCLSSCKQKCIRNGFYVVFRYTLVLKYLKIFKLTKYFLYKKYSKILLFKNE